MDYSSLTHSKKSRGRRLRRRRRPNVLACCVCIIGHGSQARSLAQSAARGTARPAPAEANSEQRGARLLFRVSPGDGGEEERALPPRFYSTCTRTGIIGVSGFSSFCLGSESRGRTEETTDRQVEGRRRLPTSETPISDTTSGVSPRHGKKTEKSVLPRPPRPTLFVDCSSLRHWRLLAFS